MSSPLPRYWVNMSAFACFVRPPTCINYVDSCDSDSDFKSDYNFDSKCDCMDNPKKNKCKSQQMQSLQIPRETKQYYSKNYKEI